MAETIGSTELFLMFCFASTAPYEERQAYRCPYRLIPQAWSKRSSKDCFFGRTLTKGSSNCSYWTRNSSPSRNCSSENGSARLNARRGHVPFSLKSRLSRKRWRGNCAMLGQPPATRRTSRRLCEWQCQRLEAQSPATAYCR